MREDLVTPDSAAVLLRGTRVAARAVVPRHVLARARGEGGAPGRVSARRGAAGVRHPLPGEGEGAGGAGRGHAAASCHSSCCSCAGAAGLARGWRAAHALAVLEQVVRVPGWHQQQRDHHLHEASKG